MSGETGWKIINDWRMECWICFISTDLARKLERRPTKDAHGGHNSERMNMKERWRLTRLGFNDLDHNRLACERADERYTQWVREKEAEWKLAREQLKRQYEYFYESQRKYLDSIARRRGFRWDRGRLGERECDEARELGRAWTHMTEVELALGDLCVESEFTRERCRRYKWALLVRYGFDESYRSLWWEDPAIVTSVRLKWETGRLLAADPSWLTDSVDPSSTRGRLIIQTYWSDNAGWRGVRYWCAEPELPQYWHGNIKKVKDTQDLPPPTPALYSSQAAVLSRAESDEPVGHLTVPELSARIIKLWGGILPPSVTASDLYNEWLSYFIQGNHDYGVVHAWVSALREWLRQDWQSAEELAECCAHVESDKA